MNAIAIQTQLQTAPRQRMHTTLLDLVWAVSEVTRDETELVTAVVDLLESGRARLTGNFRDIPIEVFRAARNARN
jgi:hypothetical protein